METGGIEYHEAMLANMMAWIKGCHDDVATRLCYYLCLVIVIWHYVTFMLIGRPGVISGAPGFQLTFYDISLGPPNEVTWLRWATHPTIANSSMHKLGIALGSTQTSRQARLI